VRGIDRTITQYQSRVIFATTDIRTTIYYAYIEKDESSIGASAWEQVHFICNYTIKTVYYYTALRERAPPDSVLRCSASR
jgi:hypothetical protein